MASAESTSNPNYLRTFFGTTPKGLTTRGFPPGGNIVMAFSAAILATALVAIERCSNAEEEFFISLSAGVITTLNNWYPSSIHCNPTELRTNIL